MLVRHFGQLNKSIVQIITKVLIHDYDILMIIILMMMIIAIITKVVIV